MIYNALGDLFYLTFRALNGGNSSLVLFHRYCQERGIPYGGGVEQKFKPPLSKLVSDWVSSIADKLAILVLRIFSFVRLLFCFVLICLSLLRFACVCFPLFVVRVRSKVPKLVSSVNPMVCLVSVPVSEKPTSV